MKKFLLLAVIPFLLAGCLTTKTGDKVGVVVKVSREGMFCPTYEAEIVRGGLNAGTGVNGQAFYVTVPDKQMADKLEAAMNDGKEVHITYHQEWATFCRSDSDNYFLDSFEVK